MGEGQWFQPTVRNRLPLQAIILANFSIQYGKFYDINNRFNETISAQGTNISSDHEHQWGHCGRESSPSGTEGSFEVHLEKTGERIATIHWDCPYIGDNKLTKRDVQAGFAISFDDFSIRNGALGSGTINIRVD